MRKGDILLFKDSGLISKLIRGISGGKYSHTAMCVDSSSYFNCFSIIESTWKGIKINVLKEDDYKYVDVFRFNDIYDQLENKLAYDAIQYINRKYDYKLLFTIMLNKWFGFMPVDGQKKFICSEFIDMIYKKNGIDIIPSIVNDNVTPNELGKILNANTLFRKVDIYG